MELIKLQRKVAKMTAKYRAEYKRRLKNEKRRKEPYEHLITRYMRESTKGTPFSLDFRVRTGEFVGSKRNCEIDLVNETGLSYGWWEMLKRINGVLTLNTHAYSHSTAKHINKAASVLKALGLKFETIEAPQGLQDLEAAKRRELELYATMIVSNKYARNKVSDKAIQRATNERFQRLARLGIAFDLSDMSDALNNVEQRRRAKLDRDKRRRFDRKVARVTSLLESVIAA